MHAIFPGGCAVLAATKVEKIEGAEWKDLGMPETLWINKVKEFGLLIISIDTKGRNLIEENKKVFNEKKKPILERINQQIGFINRARRPLPRPLGQQPPPHGVDVVAQRKQLVGVRQRHGDAVGHAVEFVQLIEQFVALAQALFDLRLDAAQPCVPAEDALAHAVGVQRWHHAAQGQQKHDQAADHQPHALRKLLAQNGK